MGADVASVQAAHIIEAALLRALPHRDAGCAPGVRVGALSRTGTGSVAGIDQRQTSVPMGKGRPSVRPRWYPPRTRPILQQRGYPRQRSSPARRRGRLWLRAQGLQPILL